MVESIKKVLMPFCVNLQATRIQSHLVRALKERRDLCVEVFQPVKEIVVFEMENATGSPTRHHYRNSQSKTLRCFLDCDSSSGSYLL